MIKTIAHYRTEQGAQRWANDINRMPKPVNGSLAFVAFPVQHPRDFGWAVGMFLPLAQGLGIQAYAARR